MAKSLNQFSTFLGYFYFFILRSFPDQICSIVDLFLSCSLEFLCECLFLHRLRTELYAPLISDAKHHIVYFCSQFFFFTFLFNMLYSTYKYMCLVWVFRFFLILYLLKYINFQCSGFIKNYDLSNLKYWFFFETHMGYSLNLQPRVCCLRQGVNCKNSCVTIITKMCFYMKSDHCI